MFTVNTNSWHYKWLKFYRQNLPNEDGEFISDYRFKRDLPTDFCEYWRAVLVWPSVRIGINMLLNLSMIFFLGIIFTTPATLQLGAIMVGVVIALAFLLGVIYVFTDLIPNFIQKMSSRFDNDEFVKTAYESSVGKFCTQVEYKEENNEE